MEFCEADWFFRSGHFRAFCGVVSRGLTSNRTRRGDPVDPAAVAAGLTICGAIPPYNEVLGGKLVAMLMMSPEVVAEYRRRYAGMPSVIASSMAGRPISAPLP